MDTSTTEKMTGSIAAQPAPPSGALVAAGIGGGIRGEFLYASGAAQGTGGDGREIRSGSSARHRRGVGRSRTAAHPGGGPGSGALHADRGAAQSLLLRGRQGAAGRERPGPLLPDPVRSADRALSSARHGDCRSGCCRASRGLTLRAQPSASAGRPGAAGRGAAAGGSGGRRGSRDGQGRRSDDQAGRAPAAGRGQSSARVSGRCHRGALHAPAGRVGQRVAQARRHAARSQRASARPG